RRWCQKGRKLNNLVFARTSQRPRSWPLVRRGNRQLVVAHGSPELRVHPQHGQREPLAIEGEKRRNPILLLVGSGWVWNGERQCDCDAAVASAAHDRGVRFICGRQVAFVRRPSDGRQSAGSDVTL